MTFLFVVAAIAARSSFVQAIWRERIRFEGEPGSGDGEPGSGSCNAERARLADEDGCCKTARNVPSGPACEAWADPHISSFDNTEGDQGPGYLSLADTKKRSKLTTVFASFDRHHSKVSRSQPRPIFGKNESDKPSPSGEGNQSLDVNAYDAGDFWLVRSNPVHIQGRFRLAQEFLPDNAAIGAVSIGGPFLSGHTLTIEPLDGDATLDGAPLPSGSFFQRSEAGNLSMTYFAKSDESEAYADFEAELALNVHIKLRRWMRHLDLKIWMPGDIPGGVDGECGNMNGNAEDDSQESLQLRMQNLQVNEVDKLFTKKFPVWVDTDKKGFEAVQATKDKDVARKFIRLLLATRGAQLLSESELSGILPYYTGEEDQNSYEDLLDELSDADWVQGFNSGGSWNFGPVLRSIFGAVWE